MTGRACLNALGPSPLMEIPGGFQKEWLVGCRLHPESEPGSQSDDPKPMIYRFGFGEDSRKSRSQVESTAGPGEAVEVRVGIDRVEEVRRQFKAGNAGIGGDHEGECTGDIGRGERGAASVSVGTVAGAIAGVDLKSGRKEVDTVHSEVGGATGTVCPGA